jgi:hypothetical protein
MGIGDLDGSDAQLEIAGRASTLSGRRRALPAAQVLPVVAAARVAREVQRQAVELRVADLDLPRQERQEGEAQLGAADPRHWLVTEPRRITERRAADGDANRREQHETEVAVERQLAAGRLLHGGRDAVLVVVRVECHPDHDDRRDDQHDDDPDDDADDLQKSFHGVRSRLRPRRGAMPPS